MCHRDSGVAISVISPRFDTQRQRARLVRLLRHQFEHHRTESMAGARPLTFTALTKEFSNFSELLAYEFTTNDNVDIRYDRPASAATYVQ